ncbi:MAG: hypothetical protein ACXWB9_02000 [Flavisolibacter sp.]
MSTIDHTIDHLFRHEWGKLVSVLSRIVGLDQLETAQDIAQDTLLQALATWTYNGLPEILLPGCIKWLETKPSIL